MNAKRITRLALFIASAFVLSIVENSLPPIFAFAPGAKMGLSNVVSLVAVVILGTIDAYFVLIVRCIMSSIVSGNYFALIYSIIAGVFSLSVEVVLIKMPSRHLSIVSISFIGALVHNFTQLCIAGIIVKTSLLAALPIMLIASVIAGLFVGFVGYYVIMLLPKEFYILPRENNLRSDYERL